MENFTTPSFNSAPMIPASTKRAGSKRLHTLALAGAGLLVAATFLFATGGFSALSSIFGSRAGTEVLFAGANALQGNQDAPAWVLGADYPAILDGTGVVSSFTGLADDTISGGPDLGMVIPLITSLNPDENIFTSHTYTSPALNLGTGADSLTTMEAYLYLPRVEDATVVSYRTAADPAGLSTASFVTLLGNPVASPANESIKVITSDLVAGSLSQYLQIKVNFQTFDLGHRTAFYGIKLDVANASADDNPSADNPDQEPDADLNGDGVVDILDASILLNEMQTPPNPDLTP